MDHSTVSTHLLTAAKGLAWHSDLLPASLPSLCQPLSKDAQPQGRKKAGVGCADLGSARAPAHLQPLPSLGKQEHYQ